VKTEREPLILSIDATTLSRSVAVMRGRHLRAFVTSDDVRTNSAKLLNEIDEALHEAEVKIDGIDLFAVTIGPGSFTGLRSGMATVKAFASTLDRPVVGISTLHVIACAAGKFPQTCALIPAGRGEVFAQLMSVSGDQAVIEMAQPIHVSPTVMLEEAANVQGHLKWAGPGAVIHIDLIRDFARSYSITVTSESFDELETRGRSWVLAQPSKYLAAPLAMMAYADFRVGKVIKADELRALYVRASDAELNSPCRV